MFGRVRRTPVLSLAATYLLVACTPNSRVATRRMDPPQNLVIIVKPMAGFSAGPMRIMVDGITVYFGTPLKEQRIALRAASGWHKLDTLVGNSVHHRAMLDTSTCKWVRIAREPSKPEGVGVHVTEYPQ